MTSLRERVARAIYENTEAEVTPWNDLSSDRRAGWLSDADAVIPIVVRACMRVVDQSDPEAPNKYLFRREQLPNALEGLFLGADEEWECPIGNPGCRENCGAYGCGN